MRWTRMIGRELRGLLADNGTVAVLSVPLVFAVGHMLQKLYPDTARSWFGPAVFILGLVIVLVEDAVRRGRRKE